MSATYRVVVAGIQTGFDPDTALAVVARLFRMSPEQLRAQFKGPFVARTCADPASAARLQRVLRMAGCQCEIERVGAAADSLHSRLDALKLTALTGVQELLVTLADIERRSMHWLTACVTFVQTRLASLRTARGGRKSRAATAFTRAREILLAARQGRSTLQHAAAIVVLASALSLISDPMPGYSALHAPRAAGLDLLATAVPAAPAAPDFFVRTAIDPVSGAAPTTPGAASLRAASTALGVVSVAPDDTGITPYWQLRWNSVTLRDLRAETPPSLVPQRQAGARQVLATQIGNETVIVVDSGERTAMCPASRVLLVVLAPGSRVRTRELPNQCVELESVAHVGDRLLFRFYDHAKPTLAFEQSRFVKLAP